MLDNETQILQVLFEQPHTPFHIRLLAKKTGLHPNTVITATNSLVKQKLITKQKDATTQRILIRPATDSKKFLLEKKLYNIRKIYASGLVDYLEEQLEYPTVFLFGSYAKGENHTKSDIDLFIITQSKKRLDIVQYEKKLGATIQLFVHTRQEFEKLTQNNPQLINNVLNGYILTGYAEIY